MGELIDLTLLRRAYRILDHFIGDRWSPQKTLRKSAPTSSTRRSPGAPIDRATAAGALASRTPGDAASPTEPLSERLDQAL